MEDTNFPQPPPKKIKIESGEAVQVNSPMDTLQPSPDHLAPSSTVDGEDASKTKAMESSGGDSLQMQREEDVGITEFVAPSLPGFEGILKKRYTDFLVNEILPSGEVVHLDNLQVPKVKGSVRATEQHSAPDPSKKELGPAYAGSNASLQQGSGAQPVRALEAPPADQSKISASIKRPESNQQDQPTTKVQAEEPIAEEAPRRRIKRVELFQPAGPFRTDKGETTPNEPSEKPQFDPSSDLSLGDPSKTKRTDNDEPADRKESSPPKGTLPQWQAITQTAPGFQLKDEDATLMKTLLSEDVVSRLVALFNQVVNGTYKRSRSGTVRVEGIADKEARTKVHSEIRRVFHGRFESNTDQDGVLVVSAVPGHNPKAREHGGGRGGRGRGQQGRGGWAQSSRQSNGPLQNRREVFAELGGDYLHFSLYKENKDTMEVVALLARTLNMRPKSFQFAGTKDKRAVTVQRISVYRATADQLDKQNRMLRNAKIGNYKYHSSGLELGDLSGNEFIITLRDCKFPTLEGESPELVVDAATEVAKTSMQNLVQKGFLNYFGLQRFGTFATRTDTVGKKMLREDFEGAVEAIFHVDAKLWEIAQRSEQQKTVSKLATDDLNRAKAIFSFKQSGKVLPAIDEIPKKFSAESCLIRFLGSKNRSRDYLTALQSIPRNLRLMYVHAYQSLIWNLAASHRWSEYGEKVMEGDLVLVKEHKGEENKDKVEPQEDADGEVIVQPTEEDRAAPEEERFERARPLSKEEAESGEFSIFDIVLPTPGFDILYPSYMTSFYEKTMNSDEHGNLDPHNMRRSWKDISLSGSYRKLLARPSPNFSVKVVPYTKADEQFVLTDLDRLEYKKKRLMQKVDGEDEEGGVRLPDPELEAASQEQDSKLAVIIQLQLGSSQYATMALRELMKHGGLQTYKADFGSGR